MTFSFNNLCWTTSRTSEKESLTYSYFDYLLSSVLCHFSVLGVFHGLLLVPRKATGPFWSVPVQFMHSCPPLISHGCIKPFTGFLLAYPRSSHRIALLFASSQVNWIPGNVSPLLPEGRQLPGRSIWKLPQDFQSPLSIVSSSWERTAPSPCLANYPCAGAVSPPIARCFPRPTPSPVFPTVIADFSLPRATGWQLTA